MFKSPLKPLYQAIQHMLIIGTIGLGQMIAIQAVQANTVEIQNYQIKAVTLDSALLQFASQAGVELSFDPQTIQHLKSNGLQGQYSVVEGFQTLLAPHGLQVQKTTTGYKLIEKSKLQVRDMGRLNTIDVATTANSAHRAINDPDAVQLPTITVTAINDGYVPNNLNIGKINQSLKEIPQTVTVITKQRIEDQGLQSISDVMDKAAGITRTSWYGGSYFYSRGLQVNSVRYNGGGTKDTSNNYGIGEPDAAMYEQVAILRGADGLFGAGEASGVINLDYKRPLDFTQTSAALSVGSWDNYRAEIDVSSPLAFDGALRGRAVAVYQDKDTFNQSNNERKAFYGALEADLASDTTLLIGANYQTDDLSGAGEGVPRYRNGELLPINIKAAVGAPWSVRNNVQENYFLVLDHQINDRWKAKFNAHQTNYERKVNFAALNGPIDPITHQGGLWRTIQLNQTNENLSLDLNLTGSFDLFNQSHDVIFGMDYEDIENMERNVTPQLSNDERYTNIFNPVIPTEIAYHLPFGYTGISENKKIAAYGSLRFRPLENLSLILGGRYAFKDTSQQTSPTKLKKIKEDKVFVPYYGIVYELNDNINLYASTSEIYKTQATRLQGPPASQENNFTQGNPLEPVRGRNYEIGIKGDLFDNRLTGSLSLYRTEKKSEASTDASYGVAAMGDGTFCCYIADGSKLSQGVDLELNGEILPNWNLSFGYTYNDNENKRSNDAQFSTITPRHLLKIWSDYKFDGGLLDRLSLGGGVTAQSSSYRASTIRLFNNATNDYTGESVSYDFVQPGYAIWSMRAGYEINDNLTVSANLNNLFDKRYLYTMGTITSGNWYGDPRNFMLTLRAKY